MSIEEKIIEKMEHGKAREYNLSCRDTVTIKEDNKRIVTYILWASPIVTIIEEDGKRKIEFSFCGWSSQTTKKRISHILYHYAKCWVFQKNWKIYLRKGNKVYSVDTCMKYTIEDGVITDIHGKELEEVER